MLLELLACKEEQTAVTVLLIQPLQLETVVKRLLLVQIPVEGRLLEMAAEMGVIQVPLTQMAVRGQEDMLATAGGRSMAVVLPVVGALEGEEDGVLEVEAV